MDKYIKLTDAIKTILGCEWHDIPIDRYPDVEFAFNDALIIASNELSNLPAADVVEAVRCKDCEYWGTDEEAPYSEGYYLCGADGSYTRSEFYCALGDRRQGMSGVYIPGMDMPKGCAECSFNMEYGECAAMQYRHLGDARWLSSQRHKDCPLIPVPYHGTDMRGE